MDLHIYFKPNHYGRILTKVGLAILPLLLLTLSSRASGGFDKTISGDEHSLDDAPTICIENGEITSSTLTFLPNVNKCYKIINKYSGKCKHIDDDSANGSYVTQWDFSNATNEKWQLIDAGGGYFKIKNCLTHKILDISGGSLFDGAYCIQWDDVNGNNQKFKFEDAGSGCVFIRAKHSGKCLRLEKQFFGNGVKIVQSFFSFLFIDMKWQFIEVDCPQPPTPPVVCETPDYLVHWNLNACNASNASNSSNYSEFTPAYPSNGNCSKVTATNVCRTSGTHSCTDGVLGSSAMSVSARSSCTWCDNAPEAVRFEVTLTPDASGSARLTSLNFFERSPKNYSWTGGGSGTNKYPSKLGVRVTKNGKEIFKETNISTAQAWTLRNFDFSSNPEFVVTKTTTFKFEILAYCKSSHGGYSWVSTWDIDEIEVLGCCYTPAVCSLTSAVSNVVCNDNGTPGTPSDDTYTFDLTVNGNNAGSGWCTTINGANVDGAYGTPKNLGPYLISNGPLSFTIKDKDNSSCKTSQTVNPPAACSVVPSPGSLGGKVWNDLNKNGLQEYGEPGVGGVLVKLYKCDGTYLFSTYTDANGNYQFVDLPSNTQYFVEFSGLPGGYQFTTKDAQGNTQDNVDSDVNPSTGRTDCVFLAPGASNNTIAAGIHETPPVLGSVGDFVWNDLNKNGVQDGSEPGVPGLTVRLLDCSGGVLATTTTDANGHYAFANLAAGSYVIQVVPPAGYVFSPKGVGNDAFDSDINPGTGRSDCFPLAAGQNDATRDAGIYEKGPEPASVGDFVWYDTNGNGVQDPGEGGVQSVIVNLFTCSGSFVAQTATNASGYYSFSGLASGSYYLQFSNLAAGYQFTTKDAGADDSVDSDVDPATGKTDCFTLVAGQNDTSRDAGVSETPASQPGSVGDYVWFDTNGNGIQDAGEPGMAGIFVILETCAGGYVDFKITDANGQYLFTNVTPGQYRIKFANPGSYNGIPVQLTAQYAGSDPTKDSNADWLGISECFTLSSGQTNSTIDAGFVGETPPAECDIEVSVTDVTCHDNNTPDNPNDDTYSFTIVVTGTNVGDWGYDIPSLGLFMAEYGKPCTFGPFPISGGSITLVINDHNKTNCQTTITVNPPAPCSVPTTPCDNLTNGGTIGYDETSCIGYDPSVIVSLSTPTGGSGAIEYAWVQSTQACPDNTSLPIYGATGASYDPPFINQTTWYRRLARRTGCTQYVQSNCIKKEVCSGGNTGCNVSITAGTGSITISGLTASNVDVKVFGPDWQMVFNCFNNCNDPQIVTGLPAGTYYVDVQMWNANWQPICSANEYVTLGYFTGNGDGSFLIGNPDQGDAQSAVFDRNMEEATGRTAVNAQEISLFPNPANNYLNLDLSPLRGKEVQIEVLDHLGRNVQYIEIDEVQTRLHRIDLSKLKEGHYMIWVKTSGQAPVVKQFIVAKQ